MTRQNMKAPSVRGFSSPKQAFETSPLYPKPYILNGLSKLLNDANAGLRPFQNPFEVLEIDTIG